MDEPLLPPQHFYITLRNKYSTLPPLYNLRQSMWLKVRIGQRASKMGQVDKNFISVFA